VERHAGQLARSHALRGTEAVRGADAVHLASALAFGGPDHIIAVWDRRLHIARVVSVLPARSGDAR
jgi:hypothetical protein